MALHSFRRALLGSALVLSGATASGCLGVDKLDLNPYLGPEQPAAAQPAGGALHAVDEIAIEVAQFETEERMTVEEFEQTYRDLKMWLRKGLRANGISAGPIKTLAASGISLLSTIHSPPPDTFALFHRCLVLQKGRVVYFGDNGEQARPPQHSGRQRSHPG